MEYENTDDLLNDGIAEEVVAAASQGGNGRRPVSQGPERTPPNENAATGEKSEPDPPRQSAPPPRRSEPPRKVIPYDAYRNRPAIGLNGSPPYSEDCEKGVICSMFLAPGKVSGLIDPKAFFIPAYRILHDAIYEWPEPDKGVDFFWLVEQLTNRGQLDEVGGKAALSELFSFVLTPDNAEHYIQIVQEKATLRQVIAACEKAARQCRDHDTDPGLIIKETQILIDEALHGLRGLSQHVF
jgi:DnaB-like helicase N terminal domain